MTEQGDPARIMNSEWKFLLDTVVRWLPYIAVLIFVPIIFVIVRYFLGGSCRNGPIQKPDSIQDEEFRAGTKQTEWRDKHKSLPNMAASDEIFRTVNLSASPIKKDYRGICMICTKTYHQDNVARSLPCEHHFHHKCAEDWFSRRGYCPQCIRPSSASVIN